MLKMLKIMNMFIRKKYTISDHRRIYPNSKGKKTICLRDRMRFMGAKLIRLAERSYLKIASNKVTSIAKTTSTKPMTSSNNGRTSK